MTHTPATQHSDSPLDELPGEWAGFETILSAYQTPLYRLLVLVLADRREAEMLAVEVWCCIHRQIASYQPESNLSLTTWIYRIAASCCLRTLRPRQRRRRWAWWSRKRTGLCCERCDDESPEPLSQVLRQLPPHERLALVLHEALGLSCLEVAEILDRSQYEAQRLFATARARFCALSRCAAQQTSDSNDGTDEHDL